VDLVGGEKFQFDLYTRLAFGKCILSDFCISFDEPDIWGLSSAYTASAVSILVGFSPHSDMLILFNI
jgi:hypothetical protein